MAFYNPADWKDDSASWRGKLSGAVKGAFTGPKVDPYKPDQNNFSPYGNDQFAQDAGAAAEGRSGQLAQAANDAQGRTFVDPTQADQSRTAMGATAGNISGDAGNIRGVGDRFLGFADQGPGPSAAQAQLNMSTDRNMREALAMAKSGRGGVGNVASLAQADASRAQAQSDAGGQAALLRAQEEDAWRQRQLQAYGGAAEAYQGAAGVEGTAADVYGNVRQGDLSQQQQYLTQQGMNDAMSQDLLRQELDRQRLGYDYAQMDQTGRMAYEAMMSGNYMAAQQGNQAADAQRDSQVLGMGSGIFGGLAAMGVGSDINAKHSIKPTSRSAPAWFQSNRNSSPSYGSSAPAWARPPSTRPPPAHYGQRQAPGFATQSSAPAWLRPSGSREFVPPSSGAQPYAATPQRQNGMGMVAGMAGGLLSDINNKGNIQPTNRRPLWTQPQARQSSVPAWLQNNLNSSPTHSQAPQRQGSYVGSQPMSFGTPPMNPYARQDQREQELNRDTAQGANNVMNSINTSIPSFFSDRNLKRNVRRA